MDFSEGYIPILVDLVVSWENCVKRKSILLWLSVLLISIQTGHTVWLTLHFITCLLRKRRGRDDIVKSCLERKSIFCRLSLHWLSVFPIMSVALWPPTKRRRKGAAKANKRKKKSKEKVIFFSLKSRVFSTAWFCVLLIQDEREL